LDDVAATLDASVRRDVRGWLPRRSRLSRRDEAMLRPFRTWQRALKAVNPELMIFGDLFLLDRLKQWTASALDARTVAGKSEWSRLELRLTPRGKRLLAKLESFDGAPTLFMGGHEIYGS
jgi:hypothetical protein